MDDSALISTAVLTAIWDDQHKDNIELIKPFIINIIYNKYEINDSIDENYIIKELKDKYYFNNFPHAVLKIILKRMKKEKILKLENRKFILISELKEESNEFDRKLEISRNATFKVAIEMSNYLSNELNKKVTMEEAEQYFCDFISTYGYNTYENIYYTSNIDRRTEETNYMIGEFIWKEFNKDSLIFQYILKIIEGCMIANAIYMQVNNDNKSTLKKLNCYLDSPFIVRILGYKSKEENESAKELYDLLKKYNATLYCFKHTFLEVKRILEYYKNNIYNADKESTLEYLDEQGYSEGQVDTIIVSLEDIFKSYNIHIVDVPDFTEETLHKYVIDVLTLEEKLKKHKEISKYHYGNSTIKNDVDSVNAISILRRGKRVTKIENCNYIFLTTYNYLKVASNEIITDKSDTDIGLVIDDLDLTTILWLKDFEENADLPKMRLIENAIAATNATDEILSKTKKIYTSLKKDKTIKNLENVSNLLTKRFLKSSGYVALIKNNPDRVTEENFVEFITKSQKEKEEIEIKLESTKADYESKLVNTENNYYDKLRNTINEYDGKLDDIKKEFINDIEKKAEKYDRYSGRIIKIYKMITKILLVILMGIIIYFRDNKEITTLAIIFLTLDILGIIETIIPKLKFIEKKIIILFKNMKRDYITNEIKSVENKFKNYYNN